MSRLDDIRRHITDVDMKVAALLEQRLILSGEVAAYKAENDLPIFDAEREKAVLDRVSRNMPSDSFSQAIRSIYSTIMAESRKIQAKQLRTVWIIGMPGSGKSSVGSALACSMDCPFIDADDFFSVHIGMTPADFISSRGEASFRDEETVILKELATHRGCVIALGGGVVEREINRSFMRPEDVIVYITRPLEELATEGRPVSLAKGIGAVYESRHSLYEKWADITAANTSPEECAAAIKALILEKSDRSNFD